MNTRVKEHTLTQRETMQMSDCVQAAKEIRAALKVAFPGVKFSVRSSRFSMGSSVDISWTNLPTRKAVEAITSQYSSVRRCEYTGEILSGGNMYVSANIDYTPEFRAEIESKMNENDLNNHYYYNRAFEEICEQMWNEQNEIGNESENNENTYSLTVDSTDCESNNHATLTINEEKDGIEIRFTYKPSENVLQAVRDLGFKWSKYNGGKWWAKNTTDRLSYAQTLVDTFNDIAVEGLGHDAPEPEEQKRTEDLTLSTLESTNLVCSDLRTLEQSPVINNVYSFADYKANKAANNEPKLTAEEKQ
ncbi:LPD29 domain-containing protein [Paenibacillus sp. FSL E2-0178]|uniref:LPD29 domain-containing protein n=1 Tax=Paenibacillus sp. FSL E2-0178 TaxID=2921361 RepID=UPI00315820CF